VLREVELLAERLRRHPLSFSVDVSGRRLRAVVDEAALAQLVYAGGQAAIYGMLPAAVHTALHGDPAALFQLLARTQLEGLALMHSSSISIAAYAATDCHDYPHVFSYLDDPAARRSAYQQALADLPGDDVWPFSASGWAGAGFEGVDDCIGWLADSSSLGATPPISPGSPMPDVPVLVLSGDLDANTPTEAGRLAAAGFAHATVLEIPNAGHTPGDDADCAIAIAMQWVSTLKADRRGCEADPISVAVASAKRAAELPPVSVRGERVSRKVRTALALSVAVVEDLGRQSGLVRFFGEADALRSGRYVLVNEEGKDVLLERVKVVSDARVRGRLTMDDDQVVGSLTLLGRGVPDGTLKLKVSADGTGRARGKLGGRPVDVRFTM
jgi:pimeloyl-ACP methyl ester carboxylesterase